MSEPKLYEYEEQVQRNEERVQRDLEALSEIFEHLPRRIERLKDLYSKSRKLAVKQSQEFHKEEVAGVLNLQETNRAYARQITEIVSTIRGLDENRILKKDEIMSIIVGCLR